MRKITQRRILQIDHERTHATCVARSGHASHHYRAGPSHRGLRGERDVVPTRRDEARDCRAAGEYGTERFRKVAAQWGFGHFAPQRGDGATELGEPAICTLPRTAAPPLLPAAAGCRTSKVGFPGCRGRAPPPHRTVTAAGRVAATAATAPGRPGGAGRSASPRRRH